MYTLLIADDEPMECDAIELLVKQAKFPLRIIKARNGLEAVQFFRQHGPDIIFLDIRMPGMDGLEAARLIRSEKADIPIVFLTAWSTFEFAQQAVRLQANEYLVKPVSRKDIFDLLDRILEQLEAKKAISEEREKEVRQTLNLFSTEFFTALKYNNLKEEAVSKYFTMQGGGHHALGPTQRPDLLLSFKSMHHGPALLKPRNKAHRTTPALFNDA